MPTNHDVDTLDRVPIQFGSPAVWGRISGMSLSETYRRLASGDLRAKKVGRATRIDIQHGLAWLRSQPDAEIRLSN